MLNRIEIKNFRSCRDVVLDNLGPVTVLVGRNAVGKSNILRAIQWLAETVTGTTLGQGGSQVALIATTKSATYEYSISAPVLSALKEIRSPAKEHLRCQRHTGQQVLLVERKNEDVRIAAPAELELKIGALAPFLPAIMALLPADSPVLEMARPILLAIEGIRYYPLRETTGVDHRDFVLQRNYDDWLADYERKGAVSASVLLRLLHMFLTDDSRFAELKSLLGPDGLGLIDDIEVTTHDARVEGRPADEVTKLYWIRFKPSSQPESHARHFSFANLSDGTQRVIRILVSLIFDRSGVMLLEHPEDEIHRGLLRKLMGILQSYSDQTQLIIASHSPIVFNTLDPAAVRLVTMVNGATKVRALSAEETPIATKFLEEEGSLSDFLETIEGE